MTYDFVTKHTCQCVCVHVRAHARVILDMHGSLVLLEIFIDCFFNCYLPEKQW
jgi:hypothetical protein